MIVMSHKFIFWLTPSLLLLGATLTSIAFFSKSEKGERKKLIYIGAFGVTLTWLAAVILIFFYYAASPIPERVKEKLSEDDSTEVPFDISMQVDLEKNFKATRSGEQR